MRAFAITNKGIEEIASAEIKELSSAADVVSNSGVLTFSVKDIKDFCMLAYRAQSLSRLCYMLCEFDASSSLTTAAKNLKQALKGFKIADWIGKEESFAGECVRYGSHDFTSFDFVAAANKIVSEISGNKVDFKSPRLRFYCYIDGSKGFFGIDVAGFDLGKREYRIFGHASDLKAPLAYALVKLSGFNRGKILLDPFCRSGAIAIEAALFTSGFPVNYYRKESFSFLKLKPFSKVRAEKLFAAVDRKIRKDRQQVFNYSPSITHIASSEKNAKIAGVNRMIKFGRVDIQWLELKFDKVDFIVSFPPTILKSTNDSKTRKQYDELFYQAGLVLQKNGRVVLAARDAGELESAAKKHSFSLDSKLEFSMGPEKRLALVFSRK